jgi:hypothetical protein
MKFSLGALMVGVTGAAVACVFLFTLVPQLVGLASAGGAPLAVTLGVTTFLIYLVIAGWWQLRGGKR